MDSDGVAGARNECDWRLAFAGPLGQLQTYSNYHLPMRRLVLSVLKFRHLNSESLSESLGDDGAGQGRAGRAVSNSQDETSCSSVDPPDRLARTSIFSSSQSIPIPHPARVVG